MSRVDDPMELRVTTVGAALANTEVRIVDPETGERVPIGEQGELCTRGYLVMKGYDEDPEATAAIIDSEGWLHTGDLAAMRPDGYFSFRGRAKDTIIRGGENIYPREVEDFLHTHPKIADVYVIGIPDARLGETVLAWVQLKPGAERHGGRDPGVLQRQDRLLQNPAVHPLRGRLPDDRDQENPEVPDARTGNPRARLGTGRRSGDSVGQASLPVTYPTNAKGRTGAPVAPRIFIGTPTKRNSLYPVRRQFFQIQALDNVDPAFHQQVHVHGHLRHRRLLERHRIAARREDSLRAQPARRRQRPDRAVASRSRTSARPRSSAPTRSAAAPRRPRRISVFRAASS